ncbi:MAG: response regulator transcription factor [Bacillota bacterium]|nr:response regulator transcription factor [Bacillota bacterium]
MTRLLIVDDNEQITEVVRRFAEKEGMTADIANDGREALELFHKHPYDLILLDIMMPQLDGYQVLRAIRQESLVPVILLTAKGEDYERIMGLDYGADDYVVKPFSTGELMARIRAVLRRIPGAREAKVELDDLLLDLDTYECRVSGELIPLTVKEFSLLYLLAAHVGKVFSRDAILDRVWGDDYYGDARTVDSHITRLRSKLPARELRQWDIVTVRGIGYKVEKINTR